MGEPTKFYWKIIKISLRNVPFVSIMNMPLYYSKIIFHVRETMVETDKERQAKRRKKLKADKEAYKPYLQPLSYYFETF